MNADRKRETLMTRDTTADGARTLAKKAETVENTEAAENVRTANMDNTGDTVDPDDALKLENQLCFPLYAAARSVVSAYTPLLKPLGLTYTQYIVMMALWERDDVTVGELGKRLRLDNGTLTPLLKKMEKAGLVERNRSAEDERRVKITLTDKGRDMKNGAGRVPAEMRQCMPADFTPEDARTLYALLYKLLGD